MYHWNHRVVKHPDGTLAIHEVHYDDGIDSGTNEPIVVGMNADPHVAAEGTISELRMTLDRMQACLDKPIIPYDIF